MISRAYFARPRPWQRFLLAVALMTSLGAALLPGNTSVALAADVGYRGPSFAASSTPSAPTAEKPQSKLWFNDGFWWGSLFNATTRKFEIYRYDWAANTWIATGTVIDERHVVRVDSLWDGAHLYVASARACASCATATTPARSHTRWIRASR
jgi:hypothetical protein